MSDDHRDDRAVEAAEARRAPQGARAAGRAGGGARARPGAGSEALQEEAPGEAEQLVPGVEGDGGPTLR